MSQYITKNKLTSAQMLKLLKKQEKMILSLQSENTTLRNVLEHIPGNIFWMDIEGKYLGCSTGIARIFNFSSTDEIIGKCNKDLFDQNVASALDSTNQAILASEKEVYLEEVGSTVNQQPTIYLTKKAPLRDKNGKIIGLVGSSFDITDRKKMEHELHIAKEKAVSSDHAKSQFIAVMNHELSTPLASIIGLINFLKQGNLTEDEHKKIIETIENCTHHLLALVSEVLDFSKLEKGNSNINNTFVDLSSLIGEVYNILNIHANNKGLEIQIKIDKKINASIYTDTRILLQILINLVNNAIKFTEKGYITIEAKLIEQKSHAVKLEIAVSDTGCGIPADKLDIIFEPFQQLEDTYIRQSSRFGTGLGLAIVKKLCEQLGVNIQVSSTKGQGSTFSLTGEFKTSALPSAANTDFATKEKNPTRKIGPKTGRIMLAAKKLRVLLIEDDPVIQYIHKKMLEQFKCRVDIASTGREAIEMLNQHDIVFADISLPDISGFDVIKMIREQNPENHIPIIALTVHTGKKEKQACLKAGANKFISKPITQIQLRKILTQILMEKKL
jgi:PAS domain S-box-containing protein